MQIVSQVSVTAKMLIMLINYYAIDLCILWHLCRLGLMISVLSFQFAAHFVTSNHGFNKD